MSRMAACLSLDINYHPLQRNCQPGHWDPPLRLLYEFNQLKTETESMKTYVNADRQHQIGVYFHH